MSTASARLFRPGGAAPPGAVQLAIGYPDAGMFPDDLLGVDFLTSLHRRTAALSYGPAEGNASLIEHLRHTLLRDEPSGRTLLTHGSMDAIDLTMRVLARRGGLLLAEDPVFPGLVPAAANAGVELLGVATDDEGLDPEAVADAIAMAGSTSHRIAALYTMPTGSNPTGTVSSARRRERLLEVTSAHGVLVIEDDAYAHLLFDEERAAPSLHSLAPDQVLNLKSLSKLVFPGIRIAAACGPDDVLDELLDFKPVGGTTPFGSEMLARVFEHLDYDAYVESLRAGYRIRRGAATEALRTHIPSATFTMPRAGFFVWAELPNIDTDALHLRASAAGVEILPGSAFGIDRTFGRHLRISFSFEPPERISQGISAIGRLVAQ